jgi:hypothetical protein
VGRTRTVAPGKKEPVATPQALGMDKPFFLPGETITWELTFMGIEGGRARLAVGTPGVVDGRRVVPLVAEAEISGLFSIFKQLRDVTSSWIDVRSGLPTRTESQTDQAGKTLSIHAIRTSGTQADLTVWKNGHGGTTHKKKLPSTTTHDPLSALLRLRRLSGEPGAKVFFFALGGQRLWRTELGVTGHEVVTVPLGAIPALRLVGSSTRLSGSFATDTSRKPRTFTVWISDDEYRVPLRVVAQTEYGEVRIDATSYQPGQPLTASSSDRTTAAFPPGWPRTTPPSR